MMEFELSYDRIENHIKTTVNYLLQTSEFIKKELAMIESFKHEIESERRVIKEEKNLISSQRHQLDLLRNQLVGGSGNFNLNGSSRSLVENDSYPLKEREENNKITPPRSDSKKSLARNSVISQPVKLDQVSSQCEKIIQAILQLEKSIEIARRMKTGLDKILTLEVIQNIINIQNDIHNAVLGKDPDIVSIVIDELGPTLKNLKLTINNAIATKSYDEIRIKLRELKNTSIKLKDKLKNDSYYDETKSEAVTTKSPVSSRRRSNKERHSMMSQLSRSTSPDLTNHSRTAPSLPKINKYDSNGSIQKKTLSKFESSNSLDRVKESLSVDSRLSKRKLQGFRAESSSFISWICSDCKITNFSSHCTMCGHKQQDDSTTTSSESGRKGMFRFSNGRKSKSSGSSKSPSNSSVSLSEADKWKCPKCKEQYVDIGSKCKNCESMSKQGELWRCNNCAILNLKPTPNCYVCGHKRAVTKTNQNIFSKGSNGSSS